MGDKGEQGIKISKKNGWHHLLTAPWCGLQIAFKKFLKFFSGNLKLNEIDAEDPEISDYNMIPDTSRLSESVRVCLQESDEIPADYTRLFEQRLFSISTQLVPSAIRAYEQLGVKHEQLRLISPQFETPLPPLAAAVFPPTFRELTNPQVFLSL